jgi:hypothetical protein
MLRVRFYRTLAIRVGPLVVNVDDNLLCFFERGGLWARLQPLDTVSQPEIQCHCF